uniref:BOS complex subunit TMEM147 n=1 Tax=Xiphophorus maculatus TaxID=8083 RepID=A0A3B5QCC0_XIPMA
MTHFHFGNCFALAYFLYFITYSTNAAACEYLIYYSLCFCLGVEPHLFVSQEFMKATVDLGEYKIMVAAMGWATAELVTSRFLPLWVGARGIGFDWKYIQMSFDSNISLVSSFTTYTLCLISFYLNCLTLDCLFI